MSPAGFSNNFANVWLIDFGNSALGTFSEGSISYSYVSASIGVRPVINFKADTLVTGSGTSSDPYVVQ